MLVILMAWAFADKGCKGVRRVRGSERKNWCLCERPGNDEGGYRVCEVGKNSSNVSKRIYSHEKLCQRRNLSLTLYVDFFIMHSHFILIITLPFFPSLTFLPSRPLPSPLPHPTNTSILLPQHTFLSIHLANIALILPVLHTSLSSLMEVL